MGNGSSNSSSSSSRHRQNQRQQNRQQQQPAPQQNNRQQQQYQNQNPPQQQQFPQPPPPQMSQLPQYGPPAFRQGFSGAGGVQVIQNDIIFKKNSAKFVKQDNGWVFQFEFDALKPVTISAYFLVQQSLRFFSQLHESYSDEKAKFELSFNACQRNQQFTCSFPLQLETLNSKYFENKDKFWPIIVQMKRDDAYLEQKNLFYYFTIQQKQNEFLPFLKKQVLELNNESYEISEIYGVENTDLVHGEAAEQKQANMDDCNKECIICMTDLIDTVIMPCKHMCICVECAKTFQQKKSNRLCPVCRKEIESFLRISKQQQSQGQQKPQK
ncbi:RING zinc finger protein, putative (macronuclear) [Tetrahymena thermophila SB210]|uniref:RING zinc finger protein, putative n=1 Tax=Tetrahymena thermophila (strain SB210) TaxID=312017 RepID=I7LXP9_TETTS|nr:RING zinc finger protein, putative [Tetrahymena thermophila SB210]EAS05116.3 RING zinc finger protein, putative [Tetrahymena thermophila SB210]|eukprot:XP_001025361.3 RING zinc finger protein, putative [Tetrahymena thermophila SB210]